MGNYGIKILKPNRAPGVNVENATPKDLIILSTAESHKVAFNGTLTNPTTTFAHNLGFIPFCQSYYEDSNGDLYPLGYIDDQVYDTMYFALSTSQIDIERNSGGTLTTRHYTIYYEN